MLAFGAYKVWQGQMTIGLLYPLAAWSSLLINNFWRVSHLEQMVNFVAPSIIGMKNALDLPTGLSRYPSPMILKNGSSLCLDLQEVSYSYPAHENPGDLIAPSSLILDNVSFTVEPGEKVALLGKSGAGKTTIKRLALRYMDPTQGAIKINGINLKKIDLGSWQDLVGYIPQQPQVLDGTIKYNLLYGLSPEKRQRVTDKEIWRVMELLCIDFEGRLTHGLETRVGRNGIRLSGGESQRLMIGAAILKDPRFLMIDEATSSLDATTKKEVQIGLEAILKGEHSALIITHGLNTVRYMCDKFIMLSGNGSGSTVIAQASSFEELASKCTEFQELAHNEGIDL